MKTQNIVLTIIGLFLFVSCGNQFTLQKRHYRKGLFFASRHQPYQKQVSPRYGNKNQVLFESNSNSVQEKTIDNSISSKTFESHSLGIDSLKIKVKKSIYTPSSNKTSENESVLSRNFIKTKLK